MAGGMGTAVVFGGAGGIGSSLCRALLRRNYKVICCDVITPNFDLGEYKEALLEMECDVTKEEEIDGVFTAAKETFGESVQVVANCAAIIHETEWTKCVDVNLNGTIRISLAALRNMSKDRGHCGGTVINVASSLGLSPGEHVPVYSATKHGVVGLTRSWSMPVHYEKSGVRFACICPTVVKTEMLKQATPERMYSCEKLLNASKHAPKLTPDEVSEAMVAMIQDADINGAVVMISVEDQVKRFRPPHVPQV